MIKICLCVSIDWKDYTFAVLSSSQFYYLINCTGYKLLISKL